MDSDFSPEWNVISLLAVAARGPPIRAVSTADDRAPERVRVRAEKFGILRPPPVIAVVRG